MEELLTRIEQRLETLADRLFPDQMDAFNPLEAAVTDLITDIRDTEGRN